MSRRRNKCTSVKSIQLKEQSRRQTTGCAWPSQYHLRGGATMEEQRNVRSVADHVHCDTITEADSPVFTERPAVLKYSDVITWEMGKENKRFKRNTRAHMKCRSQSQAARVSSPCQRGYLHRRRQSSPAGCLHRLTAHAWNDHQMSTPPPQTPCASQTGDYPAALPPPSLIPAFAPRTHR